MRYLIIIIITAMSFSTVFAQEQIDPRKRIQEEKVAFFNNRLELSKAEAQKFWPVYNDYQSRKNKISNEKRTLMRYYTENAGNMTDEEITGTLNKYITFEKRETELLVSYNEKFRAILPDKKVLKIYVTEVQFKDYLLKQLRTK
jgi:ABC-type antimicrobial peptide transport system permease subunit